MLKYEKAITYAANAHHGQKRKGDGSPYITHPFTVAMTLLEQGCSEDIINAAILHDTVEDTRVSLSDIEENFGSYVMSLVKAASEPDKTLPWRDRKEHTIKYIRKASLDERLVIAADKLHNINSMIDQYQKSGETMWGIFNGDKEEQVWYYSSIIKSLNSHNDVPENINIFTSLEKKVKEFLDIIS